MARVKVRRPVQQALELLGCIVGIAIECACTVGQKAKFPLIAALGMLLAGAFLWGVLVTIGFGV